MKPDQPNDPGAGVAAAPGVPAGLRYRWDGAPHVYRVRAELEVPGGVEIHEGQCVVRTRPGNRPVVAQEDRKGTGPRRQATTT